MVRGLKNISKMNDYCKLGWGGVSIKKQNQNCKMYSHGMIILKFLKGFQVEEIQFLLSSPKGNIKTDNNREEDYCKLGRLL